MQKRYSIIACTLIFSLILATAFTACAFSTKAVQPVATPGYVKVEPMSGITDEAVSEVQQAADATTRFFADTAGMRLGKPVWIVLTPNRKAYITEVINRFKISESEAERVAKGTSALSGNNLIIVDITGIPTVRQKYFLIAHELTHHYQRQIAGVQAGEVKWMLEGMAEEVGARVVDNQGYLRLEQYKDNWRGGLSNTANKPGLSELKTSADWSVCISRYGSPITYKTAGFAVLTLSERYGQEKVWGYFVGLGRGESPEVSFQKAFGISIDDFANGFTRSIRKAS